MTDPGPSLGVLDQNFAEIPADPNYQLVRSLFFVSRLTAGRMQGSGPKQKRSRPQCICWIHRNSRKSDRKKNTLSSERNWYLEVGPHDHLFLWPRWQRVRLTSCRSRVRAPPGALFFHFCSTYSVFFRKFWEFFFVSHMRARGLAI